MVIIIFLLNIRLYTSIKIHTSILDIDKTFPIIIISKKLLVMLIK